MSLFLYIVAVVLGGGWSTVVAEDNVLRIHDASGLIDFSNSVNDGTSYSGSTVLLDSDISFTEELSQQFQPIGKEETEKHFLGTFDGQGHTISNLKVISSSSLYVGLFGYSRGCTIKNVVIDDSCSFASNFTGSRNVVIGGIVGNCDSVDGPCNIENNLNMATISFTGNTTGSAGYVFLGGIAGFIYSFYSSSFTNYDSVLKNCANYGSVTHSGTSSYSRIGGIVGSSSGNSSNRMYVQNCLNYGSVAHNETASSTNLHIGGIAGMSDQSKIENCVSAGKITSNQQSDSIGSIVGSSSTTTISHSFWSNDVGYNKATGGSSSIDPGVELNTTFVNDMNQYSSAKQGWCKWLLIKNSASASFRVNDYQGFTLTAKIVLLPVIIDNTERTFSGWFSDKEMAVPFASTEVSSDTTLYGLFCGSSSGYVVMFDVNGGDGLTAGEEEIVVGCNGTYGTLPAPTRTGHGFIGWFTAKEGGGGEKIEEGMKVRIFNNHTLYALWAPSNYNVTFDTNGGNPLSDIAVTFNTPYGELPVPKRQGYLFSGWFTEANASVTARTMVSISSDHILHARWEEVTAHVEIVFGTKDLSEDEIRGIISEYTDDKNFTIAKFDDEEEGGLRVIVKFNDKKAAESFVETVRESSTTRRNQIRNVDFITGPVGSYSLFLRPIIHFISFIM